MRKLTARHRAFLAMSQTVLGTRVIGVGAFKRPEGTDVRENQPKLLSCRHSHAS